MQPVQPENTGRNTADDAASLLTITNTDEPYWKWSSLFFALAWLLTLILYIKKSGTDKPQKKNTAQNTAASVKTATSKVERYAKAGNAHETRTALIDWAKIFYNDKNVTNITQITEHCSLQLAQSIKQLNQALYSSEAAGWQGSDLLVAFKNEQSSRHIQAETHASALKPLYNR